MDTAAVAKRHIAQFNNAAARVAAGKMTIDLHYLPASAPCRATMLTAKAAGIDLNLKSCNPYEGDTDRPEYVKMNPTKTIPTMNDNGFVIWESRPIMAYLVSQYGKDDSLYPRDPKQRAMVDNRLYFDMGTLYFRECECYINKIFSPVPIPMDPEKMMKLQDAVEILNTMIGSKKFSAGNHLTIADISLVVTVSNLEAFEFDLSSYPNVLSWYARTKEALAPYGYEEINQLGANIIGGLYKNSQGG